GDRFDRQDDVLQPLAHQYLKGRRSTIGISLSTPLIIDDGCGAARWRSSRQRSCLLFRARKTFGKRETASQACLLPAACLHAIVGYPVQTSRRATARLPTFRSAARAEHRGDLTRITPVPPACV